MADEKIEIDTRDVDGARLSHMEILKSGDKFAAHFIYWFSWFWSLISVVYFFAVTFAPMPSGGRDFANIILGFLLGTAVAAILGYFYGNSFKK
jgi:hypothetical protein